MKRVRNAIADSKQSKFGKSGSKFALSPNDKVQNEMEIQDAKENLKEIQLKKNRYKLFDENSIENKKRDEILKKISDKIGEEAAKDEHLKS